MRPLPRVIAETNESICAREDFGILIAAVLSAGAGVAVVVRAPTEAVEARLRQVRALARPTEGAVVAHQDAALGHRCQAHGVQLSGPATPVAEARRLLGPGWIGVEVSTPAQAQDAFAAGADYLVARSIFPSDPASFESSAGLDRLTAIAQLGRPVFAAGGVTPNRLNAIVAAGAWGVAITRHLFESRDPAQMAAAILSHWGDR